MKFSSSSYRRHLYIRVVVRPLQREGTRDLPSLLAPSKVYRLIDLYDLIFPKTISTVQPPQPQTGVTRCNVPSRNRYVYVCIRTRV
jgi:hypothetical protein